MAISKDRPFLLHQETVSGFTFFSMRWDAMRYGCLILDLKMAGDQQLAAALSVEVASSFREQGQ